MNLSASSTFDIFTVLAVVLPSFLAIVTNQSTTWPQFITDLMSVVLICWIIQFVSLWPLDFLERIDQRKLRHPQPNIHQLNAYQNLAYIFGGAGILLGAFIMAWSRTNIMVAPENQPLVFSNASIGLFVINNTMRMGRLYLVRVENQLDRIEEASLTGFFKQSTFDSSRRKSVTFLPTWGEPPPKLEKSPTPPVSPSSHGVKQTPPSSSSKPPTRLSPFRPKPLPRTLLSPEPLRKRKQTSPDSLPEELAEKIAGKIHQGVIEMNRIKHYEQNLLLTPPELPFSMDMSEMKNKVYDRLWSFISGLILVEWSVNRVLFSLFSVLVLRPIQLAGTFALLLLRLPYVGLRLLVLVVLFFPRILARVVILAPALLLFHYVRLPKSAPDYETYRATNGLPLDQEPLGPKLLHKFLVFMGKEVPQTIHKPPTAVELVKSG